METDVVLVGVVSLLEGEDGGVPYAAVLLERVGAQGEGQDWLVVRWQPRETHLGQVVDEEVKLGGHTPQTRLNQPGGTGEGGREKRGKRVPGKKGKKR